MIENDSDDNLKTPPMFFSDFWRTNASPITRNTSTNAILSAEFDTKAHLEMRNDKYWHGYHSDALFHQRHLFFNKNGKLTKQPCWNSWYLEIQWKLWSECVSILRFRSTMEFFIKKCANSLRTSGNKPWELRQKWSHIP